MLKTPGAHSSEFAVAVLAVVGCIISAAADYISSGNAFKGSVVASVSYIVSRGLAKYEQRGSTGA